MSLKRHAASCALSTVAASAIAMVLMMPAGAQEQFTSGSEVVPAQELPTIPSSDFSSSSSSLSYVTDDSAPDAAPAQALAETGGYEGNGVGFGHGMFSHLAIEAGGGFNAPIGNDTPFITWGGNFTVGGGVHFNRYLSALIEYQFMDDKLPGALAADAGAVGGHAHIWSLTLDPVIDLMPHHKTGIYVTGGGGFYRKVTSFTDPEEVEECYYFCTVGVEDVVVGHFSSNQGGLNAGLGVTRELGYNMKAFAEARYVWINTPGLDQADGLGTTGLIPVTVGLRW